MPKAAVDEDDLAPRGKDQIRFARQSRAMEPKTVAQPVDQASDVNFGRAALALDPPHPLTALFRGERVHQKAIAS